MEIRFWNVLSGRNEWLLGFNEGWGPHEHPNNFHNFKSAGLTRATVSDCFKSNFLPAFFSGSDTGRVRILPI